MAHELVADMLFMHYARVFLAALERLEAAEPGLTAAQLRDKRQEERMRRQQQQADGGEDDAPASGMSWKALRLAVGLGPVNPNVRQSVVLVASMLLLKRRRTTTNMGFALGTCDVLVAFSWRCFGLCIDHAGPVKFLASDAVSTSQSNSEVVQATELWYMKDMSIRCCPMRTGFMVALIQHTLGSLQKSEKPP